MMVVGQSTWKGFGKGKKLWAELNRNRHRDQRVARRGV